jgi:deoxyribose-phosphate aldolase
VVTVANFPLGDGSPASVRAGCFAAAEAGADEIDVVVPTGLTLDRDWAGVEEILRQATAPGLPVKSILETAALDDTLVEEVARVAADAGVRWVKTSTGFHPAGGASEHSVRILRRSVPPGVGVKAAGGIRDAEYAVRLMDAGADLLGTSSAAAILKG